MVGRWSFPFGARLIFRAYAVKLPGSNFPKGWQIYNSIHDGQVACGQNEMLDTGTNQDRQAPAISAGDCCSLWWRCLQWSGWAEIHEVESQKLYVHSQIVHKVTCRFHYISEENSFAPFFALFWDWKKTPQKIKGSFFMMNVYIFHFKMKRIQGEADWCRGQHE